MSKPDSQKSFEQLERSLQRIGAAAWGVPSAVTDLPVARRVGWRRIFDVDWSLVIRIAGIIGAMVFCATVVLGIGAWPTGFPPMWFFWVLAISLATAVGAFIYVVAIEDEW